MFLGLPEMVAQAISGKNRPRSSLLCGKFVVCMFPCAQMARWIWDPNLPKGVNVFVYVFTLQKSDL